MPAWAFKVEKFLIYWLKNALRGVFSATERRRGIMRYRPIRRNSEFGRVYARGKSYVNPGL